MSSQAISELDLRQRIVAAVRQAENPITVATLAKLVKVKEERIRTELKLAAENHELLWNVPFEEKAREAVLAAAGLCALSKTDLGKVSAKRIRGISAKSMESFVRILADERRLRAVPAFSGRSKLYVIAGEAEGFFTAAHHFVEKKIKQAGFDPEAFFARETVSKESSEHKGHAADAPKLILDAIKTLEPVKGVPVSTLRLRNHLRILNKQDFDIAALELRKRQEVYLSQHADPHNISQEEKDLLIDGQDGTYYVGIAVR
jgi:hypothetical protein